MGNDFSLNFISTPVVINAPAGMDSYLWSNGATTPSISVTQAGTYSVTGQKQEINLVTNGNFSAGNTGFLSDYTHQTGATVFNGQYSVRPRPIDAHGAFTAVFDRTTGVATGSSMMVFNGAADNTLDLWRQTFAVTPNTNYTFAGWGRTVYHLAPFAQLKFSINGTQVGSVLNLASNTTSGWQQFSTTWNSGAATSVTLRIENNITTNNSSFAIDDISFGSATFCTYTDEIVVSLPSLASLTLGNDTTIDFCNYTPFVLRAPVGWTSVWNTSETTSNITVGQPGTYSVTSTLSFNLVTNGNFSANSPTIAPTASEVQTDYVPNYGWHIGNGQYRVTTRPWDANHSYAQLFDKTTGVAAGSSMMVFNGAANTDLDMWRRTVAVTPNTDYVFSGWAMTGHTVTPYAQLRFSINGTQVGNTLNLPSNITSGWQPFSAIWNSGANTSATLRIRNNAGAGSAVAIDEISFGIPLAFQDAIVVGALPNPSMSLGNDTTINFCNSGSFVIKAPNWSFHNWSTSQTSSSISVSQPGTYSVVSTSQIPTNFVSNGNFSANSPTIAPTASEVQTDYVPNYVGHIGNGQYRVTTRPWDANHSYAQLFDKTTGVAAGSSMMVFNGSANTALDMWRRTVAVTPNTDYVFSGWAMTGHTVTSYAQLRFSINGTQVGNTLNLPQNITSGWQPFSAIWNSGANTSAILRIRNNAGAGSAFAIDEISFGAPCIFKDTIVINEAPLSTLGNDTTLNCNGVSLTLRAPVCLEQYVWNTGATTSSISVNTPGTYFVNGLNNNNNLVVNGDFSQGNTLFGTTYTHIIPTSESSQYAIVNTSQAAYNGVFCSGFDRNSGNSTGRMMVLNASSVVSSVWNQTLPVVIPNTNYRFSFWGRTVLAGSPAELQLNVNGQAIGNLHTFPTACLDWQRYSAVWNSGASTSAFLSIINQNTAPLFNDFAIDDISFTSSYDYKDTIIVSPPINPTITANNFTLCQGSNINISATSPTQGLVYTWNPGSLIGSTVNVAPNTTTNYTVSALGANGCVSNVLSNVVVNVVPSTTISATITNTTLSACRGNQITLSGNVVATGNWTMQLSNGGGTITGTGNTAWTKSVMPTATSTNYTILSITNLTTNCSAAGTGATIINLPTPIADLGLNNQSAPCDVKEPNFVHFYHSSGRLLASINSNGQNLGTVTVTSYVDATELSVPACATVHSPSLPVLVMKRHWVIRPTIQPTAPVTVRLPFLDAEFASLRILSNANANLLDDITDIGTIRLSKYSGPNNVDNIASNNCTGAGGNGGSTMISSVINGNVSGYISGFPTTGRYIDYTISGFSEFWLNGSGNAPLPINLTSFKANCRQNKVDITWTTASEQNSESFIIERSPDLNNWIVCTTMAAASNSSRLLNYSFTDTKPFSPICYYRLKQKDFDGRVKTYKPVSVSCQKTNNSINIFPNPTSGEFMLDIYSNESMINAEMQIIDMLGRIVSKTKLDILSGNSQIPYSAVGLASGIYTVNIVSNHNFAPLKLVIN